jgi:predicted metal-dependent peptidase
MDAIMPGMTPGEEIDVVVAVDMSGSISSKQAQAFLGEVGGMMNSFDGYRVRVISFDTQVYNDQQFTSENLDTIENYVPMGGGGTDFTAIFSYLKEIGNVPKRLIVFTDGYPNGSWGDENYCDTIWVIHGSKDITPPWGVWAYYDEYTK